MTHAESVAIVGRVIARAGVPIVVGVSAPGFAAMRALAQDAMALGAGGVMIAPPNTLRTDDADRAVLPAGGRGDRRRCALRDPGLSAHVLGADDARRDPPHRRREPVVRDAEARGLARAREDLAASGVGARGRCCGTSRSSPATTRSSSTSRWSAAPTARTPAIAFPTCWSTSSGCRPPASATRRTTSSTRTCRSSATSSSRDPGSRCASTCMMRRGIIASDTLRKPGGALTAKARAEVDYLLARLAQKDPRARI